MPQQICACHCHLWVSGIMWQQDKTQQNGDQALLEVRDSTGTFNKQWRCCSSEWRHSDQCSLPAGHPTTHCWRRNSPISVSILLSFSFSSCYWTLKKNLQELTDTTKGWAQVIDYWLDTYLINLFPFSIYELWACEKTKILCWPKYKKIVWLKLHLKVWVVLFYREWCIMGCL